MSVFYYMSIAILHLSRCCATGRDGDGIALRAQWAAAGRVREQQVNLMDAPGLSYSYAT